MLIMEPATEKKEDNQVKDDKEEEEIKDINKEEIETIKRRKTRQ